MWKENEGEAVKPRADVSLAARMQMVEQAYKALPASVQVMAGPALGPILNWMRTASDEIADIRARLAMLEVD